MKSPDFLRAAALLLLVLVALLGGCNEIVGITAGDPLGSPVDCEKTSDCPAPEQPECSSLVACKGGKCSYASQLDGQVITAQIPGDCTQRVCDGKGGVRLQAYDADVKDDGQPCTLDTCEGGLAKHTHQQEVPCYSGAPGTAGVGECKQGIQHCDASFQPVGGCEGEVVPHAESCLTPGDEDCNGKINEAGEGCKCMPNAVSPCYDGPEGTAGVGVCKLGTCLCNGAGTVCLSACSGQVLPAVKEDCSTPTDDDCDGKAVDPEDACVCVANQVDACAYTGPPGTEGVGPCVGGSHTCDASGKAYVAACTAVLPKPADDCTVVGDDDCDGKSVDACTGALGWVKASATTGQSFHTAATSIAADAAGNMYAAGLLSASGTLIDLGGGPLTTNSSTPYAAYLVKLAPDGTHLWSKVLPCISSDADPRDFPHIVVTAGQVALVYSGGGCTGDFGFGAKVYSGVVVVRLDAGTGVVASAAAIGNGSSYLYALAAGSGGVYLAGFQYNSGAIGSVQLSEQPFVAKVDGNNSVVWAKGFALPSYYYGYEKNGVTALAVLPDGAVAFAGNAYRTTIDLGAGPLGNSNSYENHYFGVLDQVGSLRWGKVFNQVGGVNDGYSPSALAVAPGGNVVAAGRTYGGLQLGAAAVPGYNGYVASFGAADGSVTWAKSLSQYSSTSDRLDSLSVDALGHIGIGGMLNSGSNYSIAKLDGVGSPLWAKVLPLFKNSSRLTIAPAKDAGLFFTGSIYNAQSFDGTMVGQVNNSYEVVFGKLVP